MKKNVLYTIMLILCFMCMAIQINAKGKTQKTEDSEVPFTIIRDEYNDQSKENDICISYPQIQGLGDTDKEERINELIRKGALRILCGERYEKNELYCRLDYEIKFMNENIISICYKGLDGAAGKDRLHSVALTSTVDLKEGKIIRLDDIVKSLGTLADILLEDKFENITVWDGKTGTIKMSFWYEGKKDILLEDLMRNEFDRGRYHMGWYTDGNHFVIVHNFTSQYNEYSMDIKEAGNHILDDTFLKKINAEWGMQETEETTVAECTYENQYDGNFIRIYYPRIQNLGDEGKERRVNALIKKEVLALLNSLDIQKKEAYCFLEYEIKLMNESIFNVYYEGNYGAADSSIVHPFAAATAISLKEETVIALEDIITDRDMLEEMFSKGKFEEITVWGKNGETDGKEEEESYDGDEVCRIEKNDGWYVEENNFIVIRNGENFQKYLLGMEKMKKVLDDNFVDGIGCGDGDMEREKPYSSIRYEYHDRYQKNRVAIYYPQIRGLGDGNREKQVNALIREDALKLLYGTGYEKDELYCQLDYGIKFMGADMISIFYKGFDGVTGHDKIDAAAITTTVDLKEGKIITLNDIVADFDALTDMLLEDRFEDITMWEGMTGTEKISWKYGGKRKRLYEDLKREEYDRERDNIGWYTDGKKFIIVHDSMPGYHEYSIDMQEMKDILDKEWNMRIDK